jgi:arabinofuranosyltransferase
MQIGSVKRWHIIVIASLAVIARLAYYTDYIGHDDAYIYLKYAQNIATGNGWSFNPGEPSYGTTSPLWTLLISAGELIGIGAKNTGVALSLISLWLLVFLGYYVARKIIGNELPSFLYCCALATDCWLIRWSGTVMETTLAAMSGMLFIYLYLKFKDKPIISIFGGLMFLIRPELIAIWSIVLFTKNYKLILKHIIFYTLPVLIWFCLAYNIFGQLLPNTTIKSSAPLIHISLETAKEICQVIIVYSILIVFALFKPLKQTFAQIQTKLYILYPVAAIILYYVWRTDSLQSAARYLNIIIPLILLLIFYLISNSNLKLVFAIFIFLIQNVLITSLLFIPTINNFKIGYLETSKNIAKWLDTNTTKNDNVLIIVDVGIIGYYSSCHIIDWGSLISKEIQKKCPTVENAINYFKPKYIILTQSNISNKLQRNYKRLHLKLIDEYIIPSPGMSKQLYCYTTIYEPLN